MINLKNKRRAFTLLEMLISTAIFGIAILLVATVFGTSGRLQVSTKSLINNKSFATQITGDMFSELKSAVNWGRIQATSLPDVGNGSAGSYDIKGIGLFQLKTSEVIMPQTVLPTDTNINLVIGFKNVGSKTQAIYYYVEGNKFYKVTKEYDFSGTYSLSVNDVKSALNDKIEIQSRLSSIKNLKISGKNYISADSGVLSDSGRTQPLVKVNLTVNEVDQFGELLNNTQQYQTAISSRNYLEEPN